MIDKLKKIIDNIINWTDENKDLLSTLKSISFGVIWFTAFIFVSLGWYHIVYLDTINENLTLNAENLRLIASTVLWLIGFFPIMVVCVGGFPLVVGGTVLVWSAGVNLIFCLIMIVITIIMVVMYYNIAFNKVDEDVDWWIDFIKAVIKYFKAHESSESKEK